VDVIETVKLPSHPRSLKIIILQNNADDSLCDPKRSHENVVAKLILKYYLCLI